MYCKFVKRVFDFLLALLALIVLSPILLILIIVGAIAMKGNPFFVQPRPGRKGSDGKEKIFKLIKFRTMSNGKDRDGNLLSDELRLNRYGKFLRSTSLDELGELWNILVGDMSIVGPRPQLVKDMVFMSEAQRERHNVRPGLTGLAQINGRNNMTWESKLEYDLKYISNISLKSDIEIIIKTVMKVFRKEGISANGMVTSMDYGDYLLAEGKVSQAIYDERLEEADKLIRGICR